MSTESPPNTGANEVALPALVRPWRCRLLGCAWNMGTVNQWEVTGYSVGIKETCERCGMRRNLCIASGQVITGKPYWQNDNNPAAGSTPSDHANS